MTVCLKARVFNHSWKFDGYEDSRKCDLFRPFTDWKVQSAVNFACTNMLTSNLT